MDAAGFDDVLLETVGVGQAEIDIVDHADTVVLALMPGSGDSIQALKAGRHGDSRRDRHQQGRAPAHRHDGPRGAHGALAGPARRLEGADHQDRRLEGGGDRRAARRDRRAPRPRRGDGDARAAPRAQPAQRGARAGRGADAPRARGADRRGRRGGRAARARRQPRDRPGHARPPSCWRWGRMAERTSARPRVSGSSAGALAEEVQRLDRRQARRHGRRGAGRVEVSSSTPATERRPGSWSGSGASAGARPSRSSSRRRRRPRLGAVRPGDDPRRSAGRSGRAAQPRARARPRRPLRDPRGGRQAGEPSSAAAGEPGSIVAGS